MKHCFLYCMLFALCSTCMAQVKIGGVISLPDNRAVENAIVSLKVPTEKGERIVANTMTHANGFFELSVAIQSKTLVLYVTHPNIKPIRKEIPNASQTVHLAAEAQSIALQEVIVKPTAISVKGDTLTYSMSQFRESTDRKLKETLQRLPGVTVNDAGKVLYNGREIKEFQIEGGDLFDDKYTIALDRIDPKDVIAVDVMQHHQPIRALQGSRLTDDVALNVKLSPQAKNTLMGKVEAGMGYREGSDEHFTYNTHVDAGFFNSRHQLFATTSINNNEQQRNVYAAPLVALHNGLLSSTTPATSLLGNDDYMRSKSIAGSLNGMYRHSPTAKWRYQVSGIQEQTEGDATMQRIYYLDGQQKEHRRTIDFDDAYRHADVLLKYEQNKSNCYLTDKLVGDWNRETPNVGHSLPTTHLDERLKQSAITLDNAFRLIYRWNEVNGLDTRVNVQYVDGRENLRVAQASANNRSQTAVRQHVGQHFYFAELRQEMLSTLRLGSWILDPYWFGMTERNTLTTALRPSDDILSGVRLETDDEVRHQRSIAGVGISVQSTVERFRIQGYIPLTYAYISVHSPYIHHGKHRLALSPKISIERHLLAHLTAQLQWQTEQQDNKPDDYIHAMILRNSYEQTRANLNEIGFTGYHRLSAQLNYTNAFSLLFGNLRMNYTYMNSELMADRVIEDAGVRRYWVAQPCATHVLNLGGELSKKFYWKKVNITLTANHTRFSSAQMLEGMKIPYLVYMNSVSLRGSISPVKALNADVQAFVNRSSSARHGHTKETSTTSATLLGKLTATVRQWSWVCSAVYTSQDHARTLLAHARLYYKTKAAEWSLGVRNVLNAKQLNIVSVSAQEQNSNIFYLTPRSITLSAKFNL